MDTVTLGAAVLGAAMALTGAAPASTAPASVPREPGVYEGDATWYFPGGSACGITSGPNDLVAAVPASMFDKRNCGRQAAVWRNGKSVIVTVTDRCAGCKHGSIDLSREAFAQIAGLGQGRIKVTWFYLEDEPQRQHSTAKLTAIAPAPFPAGTWLRPARQEPNRA